MSYVVFANVEFTVDNVFDYNNQCAWD